MSLRDMLRNQGILSGAIDTYLLTTIVNEENDRRDDVYSPSLIANGCLIQLILDKLGYMSAQRLPNVQTMRIFANGTDVHTRLQHYAKMSGISKFQEVALRHPSCGMYGTTDEMLYLDRYKEVVIADYKSINQDKFEKDLKMGALPQNIAQANMYTGMAELRRQHLRKTYKTEEDLLNSTADRIRFYRQNYFDHIKSGRVYTRRQKLHHLIGLALKVDYFLWGVEKPIERFTILYENKNTQAFKEFEYQFDKEKFEAYVQMCFDATDWLEKHPTIDADNIEFFQRRHKVLPKRLPTFKKSAPPCQWCAYKDLCYDYIETEDTNNVKKKGKAKTNKNSKNPLKRKAR